MILLRYGIRCIMHYSVPVTLGLLAWNGSWQNVSSQLLSESAGKSGKAYEIGSETIASRNSEITQSGSDKDFVIPKTNRPGPESIAMNPASSETNDHSHTIAHADAKTASRTGIQQGHSGRSVTTETDSNRATRDRNIGATGHETMIQAASPEGTSQITLAATNRPVEKAAAATRIAADEIPPIPNPGAAAVPQAVSSTPRKPEIPKSDEFEKPAEIAASQGLLEQKRCSENANERLSASETDTTTSELMLAESDRASDRGIEPANLKPEVRAIAAEVPRPGNDSKFESGSANAGELASAAGKAGAEANRTQAELTKPVNLRAAPADAVSPGSKPNSEKSTIPGIETASNDAEPKEQLGVRMPDTLPDIVVAENGESWRQIAARVYGDEKMAETIWKENRDAHGGTSDSPPVAGRLVRLPSISPADGIRKAGTQLARTAR